MKRPGQPNEVASCHLFLACEDSSYMTGQVPPPLPLLFSARLAFWSTPWFSANAAAGGALLGRATAAGEEQKGRGCYDEDQPAGAHDFPPGFDGTRPLNVPGGGGVPCVRPRPAGRGPGARPPRARRPAPARALAARRRPAVARRPGPG